MSEKRTSAPETSLVRQIFKSMLIVGICWLFLRLGSLIVSVGISHTWEPDDPVQSAYALLFRQLIMMFIYPSVLKLFLPAFIPLYNEIKKEEGEEAALRFARGMLELGMLLAATVFGLLMLFPGLTVTFLAPDFSVEAHAASVQMLRQMAPGILCLLIAELYLMLFHAEKKFGIPHSAEAAHKIAWGLGILSGSMYLQWNVAAIGLTYTVACFLQLSLSIVGMSRMFGWVIPVTRLREWWRKWGVRLALLLFPLLVGIGGARLRDLFTIRLQSSLESVAFVSVEYARQLTNLPVVFLGQIVSIVMLPYLASILYDRGVAVHRQTLEKSVESLWILSIPIIAGILVLAPELFSLLYIKSQWLPEHYTFCSDGALAMRMIALGFTFLVLENILMPGLFSIKSMWWPVLWGLAASVFQIGCLWILANTAISQTVLLAGVAFVYPLSRIFKNGVLLLVLRKKTGLFPGVLFWVFLGKMALLTVGTVGTLYGAHKAFAPLLGGIPVGAPMIRYKLMLLIQISIPSAVMFVGFAVLVWATGYGDQVKELARTLINRKKKVPIEGDVKNG